jgi:hypothetical protein
VLVEGIAIIVAEDALGLSVGKAAADEEGPDLTQWVRDWSSRSLVSLGSRNSCSNWPVV